MFLADCSSRIQKVEFSEIENKGVFLFIKREDELHSFISGNKYRKLKYNLENAKNQDQKTLLTFGGAFSNHIAAVAYAGKKFGFKTIGVIRGNELANNLERYLVENPTLKFAFENGMKFEFVSRSDYRNKTSNEFIDNLKMKFGKFFLVPEGGTNDFAVKGCEEILTKSDSQFDIVCSAVGTGGTISGLINSLEKHQKVIGFPALKGDFLHNEISKYVLKTKNWSLNLEYSFGGYAKVSKELITFINKFKSETKIPLDAVYTGKMIFGIVDLIKNDYFKKGTKILVIHTGGLQGNEGMNIVLSKKVFPQID